MTDFVTRLGRSVVVLTLLASGCAKDKTTRPAAKEGAPMTEGPRTKAAKDPNPAPTPKRSISKPDELKALNRAGYSLIDVKGSVLSVAPTPDFDSNAPPEVKELRHQMMKQTQSREIKLVDEILRKDYGALQIVPATSAPIGKLDVSVELSGPAADKSRRVRAGLSFRYQMQMSTGMGEAKMAAGATNDERYANFQSAAQKAIAKAYKQLEERAQASPLPF